MGVRPRRVEELSFFGGPSLAAASPPKPPNACMSSLAGCHRKAGLSPNWKTINAAKDYSRSAQARDLIQWALHMKTYSSEWKAPVVFRIQ